MLAGLGSGVNVLGGSTEVWSFLSRDRMSRVLILMLRGSNDLIETEKPRPKGGFCARGTLRSAGIAAPCELR
jgi:hypothetical protein